MLEQRLEGGRGRGGPGGVRAEGREGGSVASPVALPAQEHLEAGRRGDAGVRHDSGQRPGAGLPVDQLQELPLLVAHVAPIPILREVEGGGLRDRRRDRGRERTQPRSAGQLSQRLERPLLPRGGRGEQRERQVRRRRRCAGGRGGGRERGVQLLRSGDQGAVVRDRQATQLQRSGGGPTSGRPDRGFPRLGVSRRQAENHESPLLHTPPRSQGGAPVRLRAGEGVEAIRREQEATGHEGNRVERPSRGERISPRAYLYP